MSNRQLIKLVERELRRVLLPSVKVRVWKSGSWEEKGYDGHHHVLVFTAAVWTEDINLGNFVEGATAKDILEHMLEMLSQYHWWMLKRKERR